MSIKAQTLEDTMKLIAQTILKNVCLVLSIPGMPCMDEAKTISLKIAFKFSFEISILQKKRKKILKVKLNVVLFLQFKKEKISKGKYRSFLHPFKI